jgi:hypothetical protein
VESRAGDLPAPSLALFCESHERRRPHRRAIAREEGILSLKPIAQKQDYCEL